MRPSLTLAALDRDALALHRAASSCCIASDAYPGTAEKIEEGSTMFPLLRVYNILGIDQQALFGDID